MFNISEKTKITGAESVRSISHLQHCIDSKKAHPLETTYSDAHVTKGSCVVVTADGPVVVYYDVKDALAREIKIVKPQFCD